MVEVNIHGIFGDRFLKESFTLTLKEESSIKKFFSKIDRRLKVNIFKKSIKKLPAGVVIMINGQLIQSPSESDVSIKDSDQISVLRIIAGG